MSLNRPLAVSIGLVTGLVAAVGFYTAAAGTAGVEAPRQAAPKSKPVPAEPAVAVVTPAPVVRFASCVKPATLERGACVTHKVVTKVVTVPARPAVRRAAAAAAPVESGATHRTEAGAAPRTTPSAAQHEDAAEVRKDEAADHEDPEGTEAGEQGEDHGGEPGDDPGEQADD